MRTNDGVYHWLIMVAEENRESAARALGRNPYSGETPTGPDLDTKPGISIVDMTEETEPYRSVWDTKPLAACAPPVSIIVPLPHTEFDEWDGGN